ncbi:hypothetical protein [Fictibacillus phosphorivorans]|uniref:hypothetical protein n=1 Tax=Fictibacillus phosphorivorans TaxID=1221500 RepID=UPI00203D252B|nr:hypothetical protein [Fictibacillus phosphorivorans]MCM3717676.1 hypothetical protein [Fictibacillus phosphorivorans]MCM3775576.1 hypothetical protein [Fictibacillus phosphorivorans]
MKHIWERRKTRHVIFPMIMMIYCLLFMSSRYDTFAWFTAEANAEGRITNATTADLVNIRLGEVMYLDNCQVESSVKITNISNIKIPIQLVLLNDRTYTKSNVLKPGQSLISETIESNFTSTCESTEIKYQLVGFQGYIDEEIVIPLDPSKMIKPAEVPEEEVDEDNQTREPKEEQELDVTEEVPAQPTQPGTPEQTQPEVSTPEALAVPAPTTPIEEPAPDQQTNTEAP